MPRKRREPQVHSREKVIAEKAAHKPQLVDAWLADEMFCARIVKKFKGTNLSGIIRPTKKENGIIVPKVDGKGIGNASFKFVQEEKLSLKFLLNDFNQLERARKFEHENGEPWNIALGQAIIDAAYTAGAERIMLYDAGRDSEYWKKHYSNMSRSNRRKIISRDEEQKWKFKLRQFNRQTALALGLRKKEGAFWVLDFP